MSDNNPTVDKAIHNGADVSIDTQPEEVIMQVRQIIEYLNNSMLGYTGIMISRRRIRSRGSDQKMSKLNRLRGVPDQIWIGQEPAHIWKGV